MILKKLQYGSTWQVKRMAFRLRGEKTVKSMEKIPEYRFEEDFLIAVSSVVGALVENGYDPYSQLTGYLTTGNELYITRAGDARKLVKTLDVKQLRCYVENMKTEDSVL